MINYKTYFYAFFTFIGAIAVSGININGIIKKNKRFEAIILLMSLSIIIGYVLTNFLFDFINLN